MRTLPLRYAGGQGITARRIFPVGGLRFMKFMAGTALCFASKSYGCRWVARRMSGDTKMNELGTFLKASRNELTPRQVGLPQTAGRGA